MSLLMNRWIYPVSAALMGLAILLLFSRDVYRLPFFYLPDGTVVHSQDSGIRPADRIVLVDGRPALQISTTSEFPEVHRVISEEGEEIFQTRKYGLLDFLDIYKLPIAYALVSFLCGIWFLSYGNDVHLSVFCFATVFYIISGLYLLAYQDGMLLWQVAGFLLIPALLNLGLRTTGKAVPQQVALGEILFVLFFSLLAYSGADRVESVHNLTYLAGYVYIAVAFVVLIIQVDAAIRTDAEGIDRLKQWTLVMGTCLGLILPSALTTMHLWTLDPFVVPVMLFFLFPLTLLYGTYRIHLLPFQLILTRSLLAGILSVVFIGVYGLALLTMSLVLPDAHGSARWILYFVLIFSITFFMDPARRYTSRLLDRKLLRPSGELAESLKRLASLMSYPLKIQSTAAAFLGEIERTLNIEKAYLLFSTSTFPDLRIRTEGILRLPDGSPLWRHVAPERIVVTSYLTYGTGVRGELYKFLYRNRIHLALGIEGLEMPSLKLRLTEHIKEMRSEKQTTPSFLGLSRTGRLKLPTRAALLIGKPRNRDGLLLSEIRYLQEAARLAGMMVENFALLFQEVEKRQKMREVYLAGQFQRQVSSSFENLPPGIRMSYFNLPVISVTGDYLDHIELPENRSAVFLGDVSGHGLGTGYLVNAMRSIVRSHLSAGADLLETVNTLNSFLLDRYEGNEFFTLFALVLDREKGDMEYLNAAHPGPLIRTPQDDKILKLEDTQRLLGVLPSPYRSSHYKLRPGQRLFLCSDGVLETFAKNEEAFGEQRFARFLLDEGDRPLEEINLKLREELDRFRGSRSPDDDTTFLALEFNPKQNPLTSLLSFLRWDKDRSEAEAESAENGSGKKRLLTITRENLSGAEDAEEP
ncbi:MAG: SpoIIE family protein phosphatase [Leptospiraceae bacterium]|nr:SpoIIE family protein phosphatase [Leptospiraceae bacterium]